MAWTHDEMAAVFREHLATPEAHAALASLADLVGEGRRVALLCYEADPAHCHRTPLREAVLAGWDGVDLYA